METEWNEKEKIYTSLCSSVEVLTSNIEKVQKEKDYIKGVSRLSNEFQCLQEMYQDKESKQAVLIEELREKERNLKVNRAARLEQVRNLFTSESSKDISCIDTLLYIVTEGNVSANCCYSKVEDRTR